MEYWSNLKEDKKLQINNKHVVEMTTLPIFDGLIRYNKIEIKIYLMDFRKDIREEVTISPFQVNLSIRGNMDEMEKETAMWNHDMELKVFDVINETADDHDGLDTGPLAIEYILYNDQGSNITTSKQYIIFDAAIINIIRIKKLEKKEENKFNGEEQKNVHDWYMKEMDDRKKKEEIMQVIEENRPRKKEYAKKFIK